MSSERLPWTLGRWQQIALWLLGQGLVTSALAWAAFQAQQDGVAPAVLFPLAVGAAVGAACAGLARFLGVPPARAVIVSAACWGLLAVVGQDYIGHRHHVRQYERQLSGQSSLAALALDEQALRPSFASYLRGVVSRQPGWWIFDLAATTLAAAVAATLCRRR
jgi:hypothetical protein